MKSFSNICIFAGIITAATGALCLTEITLASVNIRTSISPTTVTSASGLPKKYTETVTSVGGDKISFDMVLIPGGEFLMGSSDNEAGRKDNEGPQHKVRLKPFYLCTTETTYELFWVYYEETVQRDRDKARKKVQDVDAITGPTPIYGDPTMGMGGGTKPAIGATWLNAMTFCRWLSKKTGKKYRLPTEAEWEYAARAGTETVYFFGNDSKQLSTYAWFEDNSEQATHEVAKKKPNPWGLYDMLGNVLEWVQDFYNPTAYAAAAKKSPVLNPKGPKQGKVHVARGGSWESGAEDLRCAARAFEEDFWRFQDPQDPKSKWWLPQMGFIGFRVARTAEAAESEPRK
ncbi:MAG: SUMF1/EgtB/PvdO family nonheme iron enzyme [Phycisphaerae bacterium]|nr:formylglycine-generating enzyme family protein [Phycisphaerae bacterium]NIU08413.1 formylglycine-generating enzyme family protein [Phycisphaerae bacterium]NIU55915.1 SUMF1/EgtB/PvdO family nonheme iron enzyme [Phycisphaerae bacterium]NIW92421.1 SUMF1/EgtB/PvdO family nonheme iron enzyme [Phycisphaerae bacterium]